MIVVKKTHSHFVGLKERKTLLPSYSCTFHVYLFLYDANLHGTRRERYYSYVFYGDAPRHAEWLLVLTKGTPPVDERLRDVNKSTNLSG